MIQSTQGLVLRSVKYRETSLVVTIFTRLHGVQAYLVQGVRTASAKGRSSRAGLLQPATLLDLSVYHKPGQGLHRIREYSPAYFYTTLQEEVVKNSVALYSVELLLRLLPGDAAQPELFDAAFDYFVQLDQRPAASVANFPLFFTILCSRALGYEVSGEWSSRTPHLNLHEGGYTEQAPMVRPFVSDEDAAALARLLAVRDYDALEAVHLNAEARFRLLDWFLEFLHRHTEHLGTIRSLGVLRAVLH